MLTSQLVISLTISLPHFERIVFNNGQIVLSYGYWVLRLLIQGLPVRRKKHQVGYGSTGGAQLLKG